MTAPRDMSKRDPAAHLLMMIAQGQEGYIEGMETDGQRQLVESSVLPRDLNGGRQEEYEALGFVFGDPVDDLFCDVDLPLGWKREGSDHSMWSYVVDERGIRRVAVFYKAAFYDRSAHMNIQNVGQYLAQQIVWGDTGDDTTPYDVLTEAEIADMRAAMHGYVENSYNPEEQRDRAVHWLSLH